MADDFQSGRQERRNEDGAPVRPGGARFLLLGKASGTERCALCHARAHEAIRCEACGAKCHPECLAEFRGCPTLGCVRRHARRGVTERTTTDAVLVGSNEIVFAPFGFSQALLAAWAFAFFVAPMIVVPFWDLAYGQRTWILSGPMAIATSFGLGVLLLAAILATWSAPRFTVGVVLGGLSFGLSRRVLRRVEDRLRFERRIPFGGVWLDGEVAIREIESVRAFEAQGSRPRHRLATVEIRSAFPFGHFTLVEDDARAVVDAVTRWRDEAKNR